MARVPRSPQRWANPRQGGQVPNNRASHLQIWLLYFYCVHNIRRWAFASCGVNEWVDLRLGFRLKFEWNCIGKVEPWPGCACVTGGGGSAEERLIFHRVQRVEYPVSQPGHRHPRPTNITNQGSLQTNSTTYAGGSFRVIRPHQLKRCTWNEIVCLIRLALPLKLAWA